MAALDQTIIGQLRQVSVATVTTALYKRGLRNQMIQDVYPVGRNRPADERLIGPAYTLRYMPAREDLNGLEVFRDRGHPPAQPRVVAGDPVQHPVGGRVVGPVGRVVAGEGEPVDVAGGVGRPVEAGEDRRGAAVGDEDLHGPHEVPAAVVVDVVADHAAARV